ncbi:hypothetical protein D9M71_577090 [compost metagenome]
MGLDADDLDLGAQVFHVSGDARDQSAAAHRHEDRVQLTRLLAQDFHGHGALAGDHIRVVVRWHEGRALLFGQRQGMGQCLRETVTVQHHVAAARAHAADLEFRRCRRHDDACIDTQLPRRQRHTLGMVASRSCDHTAGALLRIQLRQARVGATDLEGEGRLQVFAFEQHLVAQLFAQRPGRLQGRLLGNIVDWRGEDLLDVARQQLQLRNIGVSADGTSLEDGHERSLSLAKARERNEKTRLQGGLGADAS